MWIDAHVHTFPVVRGTRLGTEEVTSERYGWVRRQGRGLERFFPPSFEYSGFPAEQYREYMTWCGVEKAVLFQSYVYGTHNEYIHELYREHPETYRILGLVDPRREEAAGEVAGLLDLGFSGIKVESPDLPLRLTDKGFFACCEKLADRGAVLAIDLGWEPESCYYYQMDELKSVMKSFPGMMLHLTHVGLGGRSIGAETDAVLADVAELKERCRRIVFDVSAFPFLAPEEEEFPFPSAQELLNRVIDVVGTDTVMWGSDAPQILRRCTYAQSARWVQDCPGLDEKTKRAILFDNCDRWYFSPKEA